MKIHAFADLYSQQIATGGTLLVSASGSNSGLGGGDLAGTSGDMSVVGLGSTVALSSNMTGSVGDVLTIVTTSPLTAQFATPSNSPGASVGSNAAIVAVFDGAGSAISAGAAVDVEVPFAATILRATMLADQDTSSVVAVWRDTYANYPPTIADAITGAAPPTTSAAAKSQDTTLTGWNKTIVAGDTIRFSVASNSAATRLTCSLVVARGLP